MRKLNRILAILFIALMLTSCDKNEVDGIIIGQTLFDESKNSSRLRELKQLIGQTLNKDEKALKKLIIFRCEQRNGACGDDLGHIIIQIIYKMGEKEFMKMVRKLDPLDALDIGILMNAGLVYNYEGDKTENQEKEYVFPELSELLKSKKDELSGGTKIDFSYFDAGLKALEEAINTELTDSTSGKVSDIVGTESIYKAHYVLYINKAYDRITYEKYHKLNNHRSPHLDSLITVYLCKK